MTDYQSFAKDFEQLTATLVAAGMGGRGITVIAAAHGLILAEISSRTVELADGTLASQTEAR